VCVSLTLAGGPAPVSTQSGFETMRIRGQIAIEGGGPLSGARIRTDAVRGATMSQFAAQREFTARSARDGEWSILGITRGLWILEVTAPDYLPHVLVVPIAMMLQPEPVPWDTSLSLQPVTAVAPVPESATGAGRLLLDAADLAIAKKDRAARETLMRLAETSLDARALCAAGDIALVIRDAALARRFFELAAAPTANGTALNSASRRPPCWRSISTPPSRATPRPAPPPPTSGSSGCSRLRCATFSRYGQ